MPTTADYLSDLKAQKSALYAVLKAAGETVSEDETLDTLVPKVAKAIVDNKKYADDSFAPVIKNKVVGTDTLTVKDVSPIEHNLKVKVTPKVIFETIAEAETLEFEEYYTLNASQSIRASVCTLRANIVSTSSSVVTAVLLNSESAEEGRFTLNVTPGNATEINEQLNLNNSLISKVILYEGTDHITGEETFSGVSVTGLEITVSGYSAVPEEVTVSRYGKNLFGVKKEDFESMNIQNMRAVLQLCPNTTYTLSSNATGEKYAANIYFNGTSSQNDGVYQGQPRTKTTDESGELYVLVKKAIFDGIFTDFYIQLEVGSKATEYEPYINPVSAIANADGEVMVTSISPSMTLCSNKRNIAIELEYNADTKLYIDSKLG